VGPKASLDIQEKGKKSLASAGITTPDHPVCSLGTIPTMLASIGNN